MKKKITEKSFDGHFFVDNAVYRDGVPVNTENHSEHCRYGAFFFGIADREHFSELWDLEYAKDLRRLQKIKKKDVERARKYKWAYQYLLGECDTE